MSKTHGQIVADKYYEQFLNYPLRDDFKQLADLIDEEFDKSCEDCMYEANNKQEGSDENSVLGNNKT